MNLEVKFLSNLRHLARLIKTPSTKSRELRRPSPICLLLSKENEKTKRHDGSFISNNIILVFQLLKRQLTLRFHGMRAYTYFQDCPCAKSPSTLYCCLVLWVNVKLGVNFELSFFFFANLNKNTWAISEVLPWFPTSIILRRELFEQQNTK